MKPNQDLDRVPIICEHNINYLTLIVVSFFIAFPYASASADAVIFGEVKRLEERSWDDCFVSIKGPIIHETVHEFRRLFPDIGHYWETGLTVCLESKGGIFAAGLELGNFISSKGLATKVGPGKSCLSACALAFMGGTFIYANSSDPARFMHSTAEVGFHAPTSNSAALRASPVAYFDASLLALSEFLQVGGRRYDSDGDIVEISWSIPVNILAAILQKKGDDYFFVDTPRKAHALNISVYDVQFSGYNFNYELLLNFCIRAYALVGKHTDVDGYVFSHPKPRWQTDDMFLHPVDRRAFFEDTQLVKSGETIDGKKYAQFEFVNEWAASYVCTVAVKRDRARASTIETFVYEQIPNVSVGIGPKYDPDSLIVDNAITPGQVETMNLFYSDIIPLDLTFKKSMSKMEQIQ